MIPLIRRLLEFGNLVRPFTEYYQNVEKFFPKPNFAQVIPPAGPRPGVIF